VKKFRRKKMRKVLFCIFAVLVLALSVFAEEPAATTAAAAPEAAATAVPPQGWLKPVVTGAVNFSQAGFDNWAAGGENNWAWTASLLAGENFDMEKWLWENTLKLKYGMIDTETADPKKSDDEIRLDSMLRYRLGIKIDPFVAFMAQTQMTAGYVYSPEKIEVSAFMDPGYLKESLGFVYSPVENLSLRIGAAVKHTVTDKYALLYAGGTDKFKSEPGAEAVLDYMLKLAENVIYVMKAEAFSDFKASDRTDLNWDNTITFKFNEYFNMGFNFMMKYDKDVSTKRQIKESLTAGITYNFI
jgi:hypothetical protein